MTPEHFWTQVKRGKPDECWPWIGFTNKKGYGQFHDGKGKKRFTERAHRYAWKVSKGRIPKGKNVLHECDNPPCCNPRHLWTGTQLDNMRDMAAKGRRVNQIGSKHGRAKLNERAVASLRRRQAAGKISYSWIMKKYGLSKRTVAMMIKRLTWKHVA